MTHSERLLDYLAQQTPLWIICPFSCSTATATYLGANLWNLIILWFEMRINKDLSFVLLIRVACGKWPIVHFQTTFSSFWCIYIKLIWLLHLSYLDTLLIALTLIIGFFSAIVNQSSSSNLANLWANLCTTNSQEIDIIAFTYNKVRI